MLYPTAFILILLSMGLPNQSLGNEQANVVYFNFSSSSFAATGKWASTSPDPKEQPAFPEEVQLDCFAASHTCVEAIAEYYMGHPHVSTDYYQILKWDRNGILATDSSAVCVTQTILINFADRSVSAADAPKQLDDKTKSACKFFGVAKSSHSLVFVLKGSDQWNKDRSVTSPNKN